MKTLLLLQLFISLILAANPFKQNQGQNYDAFAAYQQSEISEAHMDFAVKIYKFVSSSIINAPSNLFFSPFSVYTTLSMLALGARSTTRLEILQGMGLNATKTNTELHEDYRKFLQVVNQQTEDVKFKLGNEIFINELANILPEYQQNVTYYYNASIQTLSFSDPQNAEKTINRFVSDRTGLKIQNLVGNLDPKTLMVLLDHMVFQAKWKSEFDPQHTEERSFTVNESTSVLVPMMHRRGLYKTYKDNELKCDVVEVPYAGKVSLLIIVPQLGDLRMVEKKLTPRRIKHYFSSKKNSLLDLYIPKVSFNTPVNVQFGLLTMGIASIFSSDNADFSKISKKARIRVSKILHQSFMSIEERGTTVRSATAAQLNYVLPSPEFKADRPFLMLVYHKPTKTILGMGRLKEPSSNNPGQGE
ncbi:serine protease inhibitor A6-like [Lithobates pipiens]